MRHSHDRDMGRKDTAKSFSLSVPSQNPHSYAAKKVLTSSWGEYVSKVGAGALHIRADLTFQKGMMMHMPASGGRPPTRFYQSINEDIARDTISTFLTRMNYAAYKHAAKRYGKKLRVVTAVEGGKTELRQYTRTTDRDKHLHAHLLLEQPDHMTFSEMYDAITKNWYALKWTNIVSKIEPIESLYGSAAYNAKSSTDSLDLENTYL